MPEDAGERSQEATPHHRQQAREQGQVAKSQDLGSALLLVGTVSALLALGGGLVTAVFEMTRSHLGHALAEGALSPADCVELWQSVSAKLAAPLLQIMLLALAIAVLSNLFQIGFLFLPAKLVPNFGHINPLKGVKRLFSLPSLMRLLFGIFKVLVVFAVAGISLYLEREQILALATVSVGAIAVFIFEVLLWTALKIGAALLLLALLDFAFQRWKHEQDLRMTPQQVRDEFRNLQGDPQVLSRRRAVQRQLAAGRLASAVPQADVVVTNPTELAVAIQYEPQTMAAPVVLAKGAGVLAQRIRKLALEHGIPIVEKKPLAQALFREVEEGQPVPTQHYAAVAEVLAYVYRLQGRPAPQVN